MANSNDEFREVNDGKASELTMKDMRELEKQAKELAETTLLSAEEAASVVSARRERGRGE